MALLASDNSRLVLPHLSGRFPFRLGTTSYIVPADMRTNVAALATYVDDIELLFFESESIRDLPDADTLRYLQDIAAQHDVTYTIHLPLDCHLGDADATARNRAVSACRHIIELTAPLSPFAFILHLNTKQEAGTSEAVSRWQERTSSAVSALVEGGLDPACLCIENLDYPFARALPVVEALDLSVCVDIGHLIKNGEAVQQHIDRLWNRTKVVHLHGVTEGRDHQALSHLSSDILAALLTRLDAASAADRVVTIEVFNQSALIESMDFMEAMLK